MQTELNVLNNLGFKSQTVPVLGTLAPNTVLKYSGFHLSYCKSSRDYGCPTTALVIKGRVFFLLNGNHCAAMAAAAAEGEHCAEAVTETNSGILACLKYFAANIDKANPLSEHLSAVGLAADPFNLQASVIEVAGMAGVDLVKFAASHRSLSV